MSTILNATHYSDRPHILVIDDDKRLRDLLSTYLNENGFVVMNAEHADTADAILKDFSFDLIIVDVMMPGRTGYEFSSDFRTANDTPLLMLTALGETQDRIKGFEAGIDDYLPKPFEPKELLLRIQAILRRRPPPRRVLTENIVIGPWTLPPDRNVLENGAEVLRLTDIEASFLRTLAQKPGVALSRQDVTEKMGMDAEARSIDVLVTRLRRKLEPDAVNPRYLQTVRGAGYLLRTS